MGLTGQRRKALERRKSISIKSEVMRPSDVAAFMKCSLDYCYDHWKEMGGVKKVVGKKAYYFIEKTKIMNYLNMKEAPGVSFFLNLSDEEKRQFAIELLPYIRENIFKYQ
jgi:hypothetical protein